MAQNRFINVTLETAAKHGDQSEFNHGKGLGSSATGDMTLSYDTSKFTSLTLLRSAVNSALQIAAQSMGP